VVCAWNTVVTWVNCVRDVITNVVSSVVAGFADCWSEIKKAVGGAYMDLIGNCNSVSSCLNHLMKGPVALFNKLLELARAAVNGLVNHTPIGKGVKYVVNVIKKIPPTAKAVAYAVGAAGVAIGKFIAGAIKAIREQPSLNMCTPHGIGFWYYQPTDCGAFGTMGRIFKEGIHRIPSIFAEAVGKFGKCIIKRGVLSLPSPFLDVKVSGFCIPHVVQVVIKGIVGTFRFVFDQIKAGIAGCAGSHANQPVCLLVTDLKAIGDRVKQMFASNFMQQTAELIGEKVHGDKHALGVKQVAGGALSCGGKWVIFFSFGGSVQFPGSKALGISLALGFTVSLGCREGTLYPDFLLDFKGGRKIFGMTPLPTVSKFGVAGTLGFNIVSPSNDIVQAAGSVDIAGSVMVGVVPTAWKIKVGVGFKILPLPDIPMGFAVALNFGFGVTPEAPAPGQGTQTRQRPTLQRSASAPARFPATPPVLEQQSEEQEEAEETSLEDSLYSTVGHSIKALLEHDFEDMFESGQFMAAIEIGASAMGNVKGNANSAAFPPPITFDEISLSAGLAFKFCITCFPGIRSVNDGTIMSNPYKEPYKNHHFNR